MILQTLSSDNLPNHKIPCTQVVNEPTHISGSQTEHVYIKTTFFRRISSKGHCSKHCFSDHDTVGNVFQKNEVDFIVSK